MTAFHERENLKAAGDLISKLLAYTARSRRRRRVLYIEAYSISVSLSISNGDNAIFEKRALHCSIYTHTHGFSFRGSGNDHLGWSGPIKMGVPTKEKWELIAHARERPDSSFRSFCAVCVCVTPPAISSSRVCVFSSESSFYHVQQRFVRRFDEMERNSDSLISAWLYSWRLFFLFFVKED